MDQENLERKNNNINLVILESPFLNFSLVRYSELKKLKRELFELTSQHTKLKNHAISLFGSTECFLHVQSLEQVNKDANNWRMLLPNLKNSKGIEKIIKNADVKRQKHKSQNCKNKSYSSLQTLKIINIQPAPQAENVLLNEEEQRVVQVQPAPQAVNDEVVHIQWTKVKQPKIMKLPHTKNDANFDFQNILEHLGPDETDRHARFNVFIEEPHFKNDQQVLKIYFCLL